MKSLTRRRFIELTAIGLPTLAIIGCGKDQQATETNGDDPRANLAKPNPAPISQFHFEDVQETAGIHFTHSDGSSGRHFFVEQFCSGCGFVDFDNDGWLDIYAVDGAPLPGFDLSRKLKHRFYKNNRNGTFEDITEKSGLGSTRFGSGVLAGDYNNDGHVDLFITCFGKNHLYKNMGDGTFKDVAVDAGVADDEGIHTSACFIDYDNDGWLDLYVCRYVEYSIKEDRFCQKNSRDKSYCGPEVYASRHDLLYHNNRDGTFTDVSKQAGIIQSRSKSLGVVAIDTDNNGWMDLYVTCDLEPNLLLINNRDGTFKEVAVDSGVAYNVDGAAQAGMGVAVGDYDNDGKMDLFVTNYSFEMNSLYRNLGKNAFSYESIRTGIGPPSLVPLGFGTQFADFDNDGWLDVVVANGHVLDNCHDGNQALEYAQKMQIYKNNSGTQFVEIGANSGPSFEQKYVGRGLAVGDFNNDGKLDILVSNNKGPLRLIENKTKSNNHWIGFTLVGIKSNRSAIGARVEISGKFGKKYREVGSGSYLSQSDLRVHFGIGSDTAVDEVKVRWPGSGGKPGLTEVFKDLPTDKTHTLTEGTSQTKSEGAKK